MSKQQYLVTIDGAGDWTSDIRSTLKRCLLGMNPDRIHVEPVYLEDEDTAEAPEEAPERFDVRINTMLGTVEQWGAQYVHLNTDRGVLMLVFPNGSTRTYMLSNILSYTATPWKKPNHD